MEYVVQFFATLDPVTKEFIYAFGIALFLGYLMGAERELRHKDAGISTNMFVVCGAMIFTFLSDIVDPNSDSRIAAQIVSGIGFLGAGLIIKDGASNVRNLTTAASIWYSGAIGMLIGFGFYQIALISGIAGVFMPRVRYFRNQVAAIEQVIDVPVKRMKGAPVIKRKKLEPLVEEVIVPVKKTKSKATPKTKTKEVVIVKQKVSKKK